MAKYKINKGFIVQKMGNKLTIFDGEKSLLYTFNNTASTIFQKIKTGWDKNKIIETMVKKYKVNKIKAYLDFEDFLKNLVDKKIVSKLK